MFPIIKITRLVFFLNLYVNLLHFPVPTTSTQTTSVTTITVIQVVTATPKASIPASVIARKFKLPKLPSPVGGLLSKAFGGNSPKAHNDPPAPVTSARKHDPITKSDPVTKSTNAVVSTAHSASETATTRRDTASTAITNTARDILSSTKDHSIPKDTTVTKDNTLTRHNTLTKDNTITKDRTITKGNTITTGTKARGLGHTPKTSKSHPITKSQIKVQNQASLLLPSTKTFFKTSSHQIPQFNKNSLYTINNNHHTMSHNPNCHFRYFDLFEQQYRRSVRV
ncbi:hypothetical protein QBC38DRAFT_442601 [Podospora fimiseda]|uniref:Uncharacterized protein n=1 Tax=Podospora fimiseda TaxID=252190 RepID=A0AAN7GWT5_9PEZI|nr:hypothetical protein QBC38DRAFT_442601 [Podospora fimiseda]